MSNICFESYFSGGENMNPFSYCSFFSPYSYVLFQLNFSFIVLFLTSYKTIPMYCFLSACSQPKLLVCFALWPRTNQIWYTYQLYSRLYSQLVYPWSLSIWLPWYTFIQYMSSFGLITMIHGNYPGNLIKEGGRMSNNTCHEQQTVHHPMNVTHQFQCNLLENLALYYMHLSVQDKVKKIN